uniref:Uncharacterized protein n=1 Tax=Anopheles albimanus TaxID=7167 RepID=A0A182FBZ6_ANOAL
MRTKSIHRQRKQNVTVKDSTDVRTRACGSKRTKRLATTKILMQSLAAMRSKVEDLLRENEALRQSSNQEIAALRSKVEKLQTENEALRSEIIAWETENDALRSQLNASETENEALRSLINVPETETDGLRSQVNTSSQIDEQRQIFEPIGSLEELEELNKNAASKEFNRKSLAVKISDKNNHHSIYQVDGRRYNSSRECVRQVFAKALRYHQLHYRHQPLDDVW